MADDVVTGAEFGRWRQDFSAFQDRLEIRLNDGFSGVHGRLDEMNGRTRKNSEAIVVLAAEARRIDNIDAIVKQIHEHGCASLEAHRNLLDTSPQPAGSTQLWPQRRQVIVGGGLVAGGALLWPVVLEIVKLVRAILGLSVT